MVEKSALDALMPGRETMRESPDRRSKGLSATGVMLVKPQWDVLFFRPSTVHSRAICGNDVRGLESAHLLAAQGHHGIHAGGAARGQVASGQRH